MKNHTSITELFEYLHTFDYGFIHNGRKVINPKERDWFNYKTLSIEEMDKYHIGTCWDTTHYTYRYLKSSGFRFVESYYIQNNNCKNTHTFTYYYNSSTHKHCIIECSWYGHYGIHEYNDKDTAINEYFKLFKQAYPSNKYIVFKYTQPESSGLTAEQFIGTIYNTGVVFRTLGYNQEDIKNMRTLYGANINTVTEATIPKTKRNIEYMKNNDMLHEDDKDHVQESYQDLRNGVNSRSKKLFFHISFDDSLSGKTLKPRIPTYLTEYGVDKDMSDIGFYENYTTPRVCFSNSIEGCMNSIINKQISLKLGGKELYVYTTEKPMSEYKHKTNKEIIKDKDVYDANITNEMWVLEDVKLKLYGTIMVDQIIKKKPVHVIDKDAPTSVNKYTFKWHWQVKPGIIKEYHEQVNYKKDIEDIKNHYKHNMDIITEATIPKTKRKKMEDLIYRVFDALDPSGVNTARYKKLFQPMSDNQFDSFFKNLFSDDNLYLNLDIVEYERDLKLENVEKAAKVLNLPLFEHVMMPFINDDKVNPIVTKIPVPVGYIHLKPMQQLVSKKNTTSTSIGERSSLTGQVTGKDKNARDSDTENISMITIGAEKSLQELLGPRADDQVALNQMLNAIKTKGYVSQKDIKTELKNKTSLNTVDVFLMGMGFKSDLVTDGLLLNKTVK